MRWLGISLLLLSPLLQAEQAADRRHLSSAVAGSELPFSDAVLAGDTLYLSGKLGLLPGTRKVPKDPEEEVRLLMEDFKRTLADAGIRMNDLVSVTVYCPDLTLYDTFNRVYRGYFEGAFPARAFIGSGPLLFGARFEMQGIAVRRAASAAPRPPTVKVP